jgi:mannose-6-phosphate isomerase-like protein (cupin superfamily)
MPRKISADDTVRLALLAGPADGISSSVYFEVWEPGGAQPVNSHPESAEIFVVLRGRGVAHCDDEIVEIGPGDTLVLPPNSSHRIVNPSSTERLYTVTIMAADAGAMAGGFAALVERGEARSWDDRDRATLSGSQSAGGEREV